MSKEKALNTAAKILSVPPAWLDNLIQFESKWQPDIKNPFSSARGLIQFVDRSARELGYKDSADLVAKNPSIEKQLLGPVVSYLKKFAPFQSEQSLYMSVFYPAARFIHPDTAFPEAVRKVNPGIVTVQDYINKVKGIRTARTAGKALLALLIVSGVAWGLYTLSKKGAQLWPQQSTANSPQLKIVRDPDETEE
jgi:hypothetical protein